MIEAILEEAAEAGPRGVQVKRVAARAEVSVGSLYQYFPRREGMLDAAVQMTTGFLVGSLEGFVPVMAQLPLRDGLAAYLSGGVEWSAANSGLLGLFLRAAYAGIPGPAHSLVRPVGTAMGHLLRALLDGARARGELREEIDVDTATRLVQALTSAVGDAELVPYLNDYYQLFDAEHPPEQVRQATVDFILQAIGREGS